MELWSPGARVAAQGTDAQGRFVFLTPRSEVSALLVRKLGYQAARITLGTADTIVVTLRPRPVILSSIETAAHEPTCVSRTEPAALALWRAAATKYAVMERGPRVGGVPRDMLVAPDALMLRSRVPAESLGAVDTALAARGLVAGTSLREWERPERYYAQPSNDLSGLFGDWSYPRLWFGAWHFSDTSFVSRNRLAIAEPDENAMTTVEFCSRHGNWPYIRGRLLIGHDTTFLKAQWEFIAPERPEKAGGEVLFAPPAPGASAPLLPAAGMFWRALVRGYLQEWMEYRHWYACSDEHCAVKRPLSH